MTGDKVDILFELHFNIWAQICILEQIEATVMLICIEYSNEYRRLIDAQIFMTRRQPHEQTVVSLWCETIKFNKFIMLW